MSDDADTLVEDDEPLTNPCPECGDFDCVYWTDKQRGLAECRKCGATLEEVFFTGGLYDPPANVKKPYVIHATFLIEAGSADDAEEAVRSALLSDDLAPRWVCKRTWWSGEAEPFPAVGGAAREEEHTDG